MTLWLIGGVDPTGGAGLLRDAWTSGRVAPAREVHCVATALTRQGNEVPAEAFPVDAKRLAASLARLPEPDAIKLGLVPDELAQVLADELGRRGVPVVYDPVMAASDGGALGATEAVVRALASEVSVLTPNQSEARRLVQVRGTAMSASRLRDALGIDTLLLKCVGASAPDLVRDVLVDAEGELSFERPRVPGPDPRGTGCALATAIACGLADGVGAREAVSRAITWLDEARARTAPGPDGRAHLS